MIPLRFAAALTLILGAPLSAQGTTAEDTVLGKARDAGRAGRYLEAEALLRPLATTPEAVASHSFARQLWEQAVGRMGSDRPLSAPSAIDADDRAEQARIAAATPRDAIAEIVARARATRIVVVNEDHSEPRSRAFALAVARALRPLGYDVFAAETFSNDARPKEYAASMATLQHDGYVRRDTGYYTADPVFADFVRQSLALGYRPVAYEMAAAPRAGATMDERIAAREQAQADYLVARTVKAYPQSKILVYVGFSHVAEAPLDRDGKPMPWMAARLKRATGIDPLTIDQTTLLRRSAGRDGPTAAAIGRVGPRSAVLFANGKPLVVGQYAGKVDLQVVHPDLPRAGDRPGWLVAMGRAPTPVPAALLPTRGTRLVQAFVASEAADAIPVDQVLVTAGRPAPVLMLPKVPIRYAVQDEPAPSTTRP